MSELTNEYIVSGIHLCGVTITRRVTLLTKSKIWHICSNNRKFLQKSNSILKFTRALKSSTLNIIVSLYDQNRSESFTSTLSDSEISGIFRSVKEERYRKVLFLRMWKSYSTTSSKISGEHEICRASATKCERQVSLKLCSVPDILRTHFVQRTT